MRLTEFTRRRIDPEYLHDTDYFHSQRRVPPFLSTRGWRERGQRSHLRGKYYGKTTIFGVAGAIGMFIAAPVIPHLVGKSFAKSILALRWLCPIPFFRCFHLSAGDAMAGAGYQNYRLATRLCAALLNFVLNLILIPRYSWLGAAGLAWRPTVVWGFWIGS